MVYIIYVCENRNIIALNISKMYVNLTFNKKIMILYNHSFRLRFIRKHIIKAITVLMPSDSYEDFITIVRFVTRQQFSP